MDLNNNCPRSVSMEEEDARKEVPGVLEVALGCENTPQESDAIPHINLGKSYQAKVKKWSDREVTTAERASIPDRDEPVFSPHIIDHIPQTAIAAYESLACSVAIPRPGRNKELALHILMENRGNLQAAVMDLLRWVKSTILIF